MDILDQYRKKFTAPSSAKGATARGPDIPGEHGLITRLLIRYSGGFIRTPEEATRALLVAVVLMFAIVVFSYFSR